MSHVGFPAFSRASTSLILVFVRQRLLPEPGENFVVAAGAAGVQPWASSSCLLPALGSGLAAVPRSTALRSSSLPTCLLATATPPELVLGLIDSGRLVGFCLGVSSALKPNAISGVSDCWLGPEIELRAVAVLAPVAGESRVTLRGLTPLV